VGRHRRGTPAAGVGAEHRPRGRAAPHGRDPPCLSRSGCCG
jgi:hypothetical protein